MENEASNLKKEELAEIDKRISEQKAAIELKDAIERLHENEDFQKVFLDAYFEKEAERLFGLLTEPSFLKRDVIENISDKLLSIRTLKLFFVTIATNAHMAPENISDEEAFRKEVAARPDSYYDEGEK